ncbi:tetratricopeptide repeat protein [Fimbriiglobus ruber]|uniref:TPR repeat n=1 Tax=Fimbriiglobus ruber TaxID=1908690 RepID=A0A225DXF8_9BACT|nr:TPR repeat [Fimbriiglobus ruber]
MNAAQIEELFTRARKHQFTNDLSEAVQCYRRLIEMAPDHIDALCQLGIIFLKLERAADAEEYLRRFLRLRPQSVDGLSNLGVALAQQGNYDEAIACFRKAADLRPRADAFNNLGNAYRDACLYDAAETSLRQALRLNPDHADALYNLGRTLSVLSAKSCDGVW